MAICITNKRKCLYRILRYAREKWTRLKLFPSTLCYNEFTSMYTVLECGMQPMFFIVDHFAKFLGPIFMIMVLFLISSVVVIFYVFLLPYYFYQGWRPLVIRLIFGHWLFMNIGFHYFMAVVTDPGYPPPRVIQTVSICKKCISPKPPRTHHCGICHACILKMDHHCPWINNCVGHYNHRYFFLFCCYVSVGTLYVCFTCYDLFHEHFYDHKELYFPGALYPLNMAHDYLIGRSWNDTTSITPDEEQIVVMRLQVGSYGAWLRGCIIYEFMLCSGVFVAVTLLALWHAKLITRGETSIEAHINDKQRRRYRQKGKVYQNPYDFGPAQNWRLFLGLQHGRTFWQHVLLPSPHLPQGDGLSWQRVTSEHRKVPTSRTTTQGVSDYRRVPTTHEGPSDHYKVPTTYHQVVSDQHKVHTYTLPDS